MSSFANTLTNWKKEITNSFIIVVDKTNRKMNTDNVENRNKSIKLLKHASNCYLNWERFRNHVLYTLNEDTTFYYTSIRKDVNNISKVFKLIVDESNEPLILEEHKVLEIFLFVCSLCLTELTIFSIP